jgi:NTP pyrophosphatase (non-canonical NTP hydrolase)
MSKRLLCTACGSESSSILAHYENGEGCPFCGAELRLPSPFQELMQHHFDECKVANWDPDEANSFPEEIAHLVEELGEVVKAWRIYRDFEIHYRPEDGRPEGVPVELSDILIGIFYNAILHAMPLEEALALKGEFNRRRDYVGEGRQLHHPTIPEVVVVEAKAIRDGVAEEATAEVVDGKIVVTMPVTVRHDMSPLYLEIPSDPEGLDGPRRGAYTAPNDWDDGRLVVTDSAWLPPKDRRGAFTEPRPPVGFVHPPWEER